MSRRERRSSAVEPNSVNGQITTRTEFYKNELFNMVKGMFKLKTPKLWPYEWALNQLLTKGYYIIADTDAGIIPCKGSLHGFNCWDYPTNATIDMPTLGSFERTIGEDCEIVYLERTRLRSFYNFNKLIEVYAYKLAVCDSAIDVNLFNSRTAYIAEAETKAQAEAIKEMYSDITMGEPYVLYRKDVVSKDGLKVFFNNIKNNFITTEVQDAKRTILNELLTRLGINNANTDKRERLITSEVDSNNVELMANIANWKRNIKESNKRIYRTFPELESMYKLSLRFDPKKLQEKRDKLASTIGGKQDDSMGDSGTVERTTPGK